MKRLRLNPSNAPLWLCTYCGQYKPQAEFRSNCRCKRCRRTMERGEYQRWVEWGESALMIRFLMHVSRVEPDSCFEWNRQFNGSDPKKEYGRATVNGGRMLAHRIMWEAHYQVELPEGLDILHSCDNPKCFNIDHLFAGTHRYNMMDAALKGKFNRTPATHCSNGHPYVEGSHSIRLVQITTGVSRRPRCLICRRAWQKRTNQSQKDRLRKQRKKNESITHGPVAVAGPATGI